MNYNKSVVGQQVLGFRNLADKYICSKSENQAGSMSQIAEDGISFY